MRMFLSFVLLVIVLVYAAIPVTTTNKVQVSEDAIVAVLDFEVSHFHADPDCPNPPSGGGGGC